MKNKKRIEIPLILIIILLIIVVSITAIVLKLKTNRNEEDEYKIVSKYNTVTKNYQDVKVRIANVIRGDMANELLERYNKSTKYAIKMDLKEDEELLVVEYEIDFMNFKMGEIGASKDIEANICHDKNNNYIRYNDKIYSPSIRYMNNLEFTTSKKTVGRFVATIPKGLTEYKIKLGIEDQNKSYFDGI